MRRTDVRPIPSLRANSEWLTRSAFKGAQLFDQPDIVIA
jgi:hypothetical protein